MSDWSNARIVKLWIKLSEEVEHELDEEFGSALWTVFSNNERVLDSDGMVVDVGSWRYAGSLVASICGGDYLDYYMSHNADQGLVLRIKRALEIRGFVFTNWEEWERGVREGRYPCPERWREFFECE